jgi:hypothetical protein
MKMEGSTRMYNTATLAILLLQCPDQGASKHALTLSPFSSATNSRVAAPLGTSPLASHCLCLASQFLGIEGVFQ